MNDERIKCNRLQIMLTEGTSIRYPLSFLWRLAVVPSSAERDIPQILGNVLVAATSDVPVMQAVLTLSANSCPSWLLA